MSKTRILVVEDETIIAMELADRLIHLGYQVVATITSGEEAVRQATLLKPDLILMDIRLRGDMDGITAASHIRAQRHVPIIYLTAYADQQTLQRAKVTVPYGYILKPFEERELNITIDFALYKYSTEMVLQRRAEQMAALREIGLKLAEELDSTRLLNTIVLQATNFLEGQFGYVYLREARRATLELCVSHGRHVLPVGISITLGQDLPGQVWKTREPVIVDNYAVWEGRVLSDEAGKSAAPATLVGVPIQWQDQFLGVLIVGAEAPQTFSTDDATMLGLLANQTAVALQNARLHKQVQNHAREMEQRVVERTAELVATNEQLKQEMNKRQWAEEGLRRAQVVKSLGVMAAGIAHDFNNLLVSVLGQSNIALLKLDEGNPARRHVEKVLAAGEKAASLTKQILAFSGGGFIDIRPLNVSTLVEEQLYFLQTAVSKKIRIQLSLLDSLPSINADASQIQQVLTNLVLNSAEAIGEHPGQIVIKSTQQTVGSQDEYLGFYTGRPLQPGTYVIIEVADNGHGIAPSVLADIFDPFFTTRFIGRGLGLASVLGIVRSYNGGIEVKSDVNLGTQMRLFFPASQPTVTLPTPLEDVPALLNGRRASHVLLIDDEPTVRDIITEVLEMAQIPVLTASNGRLGVELYRQRADDVALVLLDLLMPEMDGEETFAALQEINPDVQVIISSGYSEADVRHRFAGKKIAGCLPKPYQLKQLRQVITQQLGLS